MAEARVSRLHIDLGDIAREAAVPVGANLVTRPTGRAVRSAIESRLADVRPTAVTVIDFRRVSVLDYSCADEVVARLLLGRMGATDRRDGGGLAGSSDGGRLANGHADPLGGDVGASGAGADCAGLVGQPGEGPFGDAETSQRAYFFLFRVLDEVRGHFVAEALARHGLAAVCDVCGSRFRVLGAIRPEEQAAWTTVEDCGNIPAGGATAVLGRRGEEILRSLARRRLVYRHADGGTTALSVLARGPNARSSEPGLASTG